jgi:chemotaxis-related protein WspD
MKAPSQFANAECWNAIGTSGDRSCVELAVQVHCRNCPVYSAGAARLLDAAVTPEDLRQRAAEYAAPKVPERPGVVAVMIFRLQAEWYALPAALWREVAGPRPIHSLPHRRDQVVLGVVNIRGELLVCVSLGTALAAEGPPAAAPRLAVIQRAGERFAFPADEIAGLHRYDPAELGAAPVTLARTQVACTRGMFVWSDRPVALLDEERLFQVLNRSLA